jgi:hypothetical protein
MINLFQVFTLTITLRSGTYVTQSDALKSAAFSPTEQTPYYPTKVPTGTQSLSTVLGAPIRNTLVNKADNPWANQIKTAKQ